MEKKNVSIHTGTSGWSYDEWKGDFYPEDIAKKDWFGYYCKHFDTVELNATFYRSFPEKTYRGWAEKAPVHFKYVLKAPRLLTHRKFLKDPESILGRFEERASLMNDKTGLLLLQLAPKTPVEHERLENVFRSSKDPGKLAVEFRNEKWMNKEVFKLLEKYRIVYCNPDSPDIRVDSILTSDTGYIRLHGRKEWYKYNYSKDELGEISDAAEQMISKGAKTVYIFFNNDYQTHAPVNALALKKMLF